MKEKVNEVLAHYKNIGVPESFEKYGNGHINDTYLVNYKDKKIILQRINSSVFKEPKKLMENIEQVTKFLRGKILKNGGDPERETLNVLRSDEDNIYYESPEGDIWRVYEFVEDTVCYEQVRDKKEFFEAGYAFGNFQNMLADFPVKNLYEIITDFHNTEVRFETFKNALKADPFGRASSVKEEIDFFIEREKYTHIFNDALRKGEIPLKVTHNDTKLNNILFDRESKKGLCVIDLDTVMPGMAAFDFGDAIRFGANKGLEDERDLSKVGFDVELFEAFCEGFLKACKNSLGKREAQLLHYGAMVMTYECGIRFLGDYIAGDTYFKISREGQNLDRARTQIKLLSEMEDNIENMKKIVEKYLAD